ncbi:hypothetical protein D3C80_435280 [compost metagenome]
MELNKLFEVGMPVMVIGCRQPKNAHVIGQIGVIEGFVDRGESVSKWYEGSVNIISDTDVVVVSGLRHQNLSQRGRPALYGFGFFSRKNLMPLPPLGDIDIMATTETPKEAVKC